MKQAMVIYQTDSKGRTYRIGWRKAHEGTRWYFESNMTDTDGTEKNFILDKNLSLDRVLRAVKGMKKDGYKINYELI